MKTGRPYNFERLLAALILCQWAAGCTRGYNARLDDYKSYVTRGPSDKKEAALAGNHTLPVARLSAASFILSREDLIPCASLPPRKLTSASGEIFWLDGSWSNNARPFVVKGSAQSGLCKLELHPFGPSNLPLGGRETFVRDEQIRFLISAANGDSTFPPSNRGWVKCQEKQNQFEILYDGLLLGQSAISYVTNESIHLELHPRVCLARILDGSKSPTQEWVFIIPTWDTPMPSSTDKNSGTGSLR
ncbi:MAG: hypothetical protein EBR09_13850 [Proteobacteria bacterium]|nr:hypothetical protein [Pseudomonadota bacterium]